MRKLILFVVPVLAPALTLVASASAVTVKNEVTGVACPAVTQPAHTTSTSKGSGGCLLSVTNVKGSPTELGGPFGSITCDNSLEARVSGSGTGFVYNPTLTNCSPIALPPCSEAAGIDTWPLRVLAETSAERSFCLSSFFTGTISCHLTGLKVSEGPTHRYTISTVPTAGRPDGHHLCEDHVHSFEGTLVQVVDASHPALEIVD
jgi:hypothetical protein